MKERKVALITGCSTGIGEYCARQLTKQAGWRVFATARNERDVDRLRSEGMETLLLDLDSADSIRTAVGELLQQTGGRLDALFNNGAYGQPGAVEDMPRAALQAQFETNVFGTQELTNAVIPAMRKQGSGRIIQNSSVLGFVSLAYRGAYNASKYALEGLSDTMRLELAGSGIWVILIEPGPITSRFNVNATAKFHQWFDAATIAASAHRHQYETELKNDGTNNVTPFTLDPEAVYKALIHALESPRPKLRYRVTVPTKLFWWLKRVLPTAWLDAVLRKVSNQRYSQNR